MRYLSILLASIALLSAPCWADETFKDVPSDHWAKDAVDMVAKNGIMNGYPDDTFKGDRHITRYELCVALANMVQFIQSSQKPVIGSEDKKTESTPKTTNWAAPSVDLLKNGGFLPKDSPLFKDGDKQITCQELGDALALVSAKLIELSVPPTGAPD
ncbi:MAG: S-layer homology domain-containing protein [Armatimonadota bacterium]